MAVTPTHRVDGGKPSSTESRLCRTKAVLTSLLLRPRESRELPCNQIPRASVRECAHSLQVLDRVHAKQSLTCTPGQRSSKRTLSEAVG